MNAKKTYNIVNNKANKRVFILSFLNNNIHKINTSDADDYEN